jgi:hypothetical protein
MHRQIVHDDGLAALERRDKDLLHITEKHRPIIAPSITPGAVILLWRRDERDILAMSSRCIADQTLASRTASSLPHHVVLVPDSSINTTNVGARGRTRPAFALPHTEFF